MTLDGKISTYTGDSRWITNEKSREYVHKLRHRVSAIMVGIGTVIQDNPTLTTRLAVGNGKDAIRVIVDTSARISIDATVLAGEAAKGTIIATTKLASSAKLKELEDIGAEVIITPLSDNKVDLNYLMKALGERKIDSVLLEGGSELNYSAIEAKIVDKVIAFIAPKLIGGREAKTPIGGRGLAYMKEALVLKDIEIQKFEDDIMIEGYIGKE
jgi:diaminohydroxyphosphoribosylaminopyrimidine deaminase/5-amino-6-(5-phosphoribosylamino)uracil reductase